MPTQIIPFDPYKDTLPKGRKNVYEYYGFKEAYARTDSSNRVTLSSEFKKNIVPIRVDSLAGFPPYADAAIHLDNIYMHKLVVDRFRAAWEQVFREGLHRHIKTFDGAYNPRHIASNSKNPLSLHTLGIAIDFNARWNGYGIPQHNIEMNREFVKVMEEHGFAWLGRMRPTDAMHFQLTRPYDDMNWTMLPHHFTGTSEPASNPPVKYPAEKFPIEKLKLYNLSKGDRVNLINILSQSLADNRQDINLLFNGVTTLEVAKDGNIAHVRKVQKNV